MFFLPWSPCGVIGFILGIGAPTFSMLPTPVSGLETPAVVFCESSQLPLIDLGRLSWSGRSPSFDRFSQSGCRVFGHLEVLKNDVHRL